MARGVGGIRGEEGFNHSAIRVSTKAKRAQEVTLAAAESMPFSTKSKSLRDRAQLSSPRGGKREVQTTAKLFAKKARIT